MITLLIATRNAHKVGEIRGILGERFRYLTLADCPGAPKVVEDAPTFEGNAAKKSVELAQWVGEGQRRESEVQSPEAKVQSPKSKVQSPKSGAHSPRVLLEGMEGGLYVLADDSGLEVDALGGAPGVHSARFAALEKGQGENSSDAENNAKLLRLLENVPQEKRTARFRCVLALTAAAPGDRSGVGAASSPGEPAPATEFFEGVCEGRITFALRGHGGFGYDPLFVPQGGEQTFGELGEEIKNRLSHRAKALERLKTSLARISVD
jgi:XTP/dITP diphosphohydrolase